MTKTHRENIPFFNDLPTKAVVAASALWDAVQRPGYSGPVVYRDFVQDLSFHGIPAPPRAVVNRWVAGVQAKLIDRPGGHILPTPTPLVFLDEPASTDALEAAFEKLTPAAFGGSVFSTLLAANITPPEPDDDRPDPALELVVRQLIEEQVALIDRDVRVTARKTVADRLRRVAESLDASRTI